LGVADAGHLWIIRGLLPEGESQDISGNPADRRPVYAAAGREPPRNVLEAPDDEPALLPAPGGLQPTLHNEVDLSP
jgi:hypothetical protein